MAPIVKSSPRPRSTRWENCTRRPNSAASGSAASRQKRSCAKRRSWRRSSTTMCDGRRHEHAGRSDHSRQWSVDQPGACRSPGFAGRIRSTHRHPGRGQAGMSQEADGAKLSGVATVVRAGCKPHLRRHTPMQEPYRAALERELAGERRATSGFGDATLAYILRRLDDYAAPDAVPLVLIEDEAAARPLLRYERAHIISTRTWLVSLEPAGVIASAKAVIDAIARGGRGLSELQIDRPAST